MRETPAEGGWGVAAHRREAAGQGQKKAGQAPHLPGRHAGPTGEAAGNVAARRTTRFKQVPCQSIFILPKQNVIVFAG